jgi:hypothetical protein
MTHRRRPDPRPVRPVPSAGGRGRSLRPPGRSSRCRSRRGRGRGDPGACHAAYDCGDPGPRHRAHDDRDRSALRDARAPGDPPGSRDLDRHGEPQLLAGHRRSLHRIPRRALRSGDELPQRLAPEPPELPGDDVGPTVDAAAQDRLRDVLPRVRVVDLQRDQLVAGLRRVDAWHVRQARRAAVRGASHRGAVLHRGGRGLRAQRPAAHLAEPGRATELQSHHPQREQRHARDLVVRGQGGQLVADASGVRSLRAPPTAPGRPSCS